MPNKNHSYTQDQKIAAIIAAMKRQWGADVVQSVREEMREEIAELVDSKSREAATAVIEERDGSNHRAWKSIHWAALAYLFFTGLFILIFFTSLGDWLNISTGWVVGIESDNGTIVGQVNSSAIQAATRNMITVLGPLVIGIVIFILTSVAAGRLKEYDRTIQDVRDKIDLRLAQFRSEQVSSEERTRSRILERVKERDSLVEQEQKRMKDEFEKTASATSERLKAEADKERDSFSQTVKDKITSLEAEIRKQIQAVATQHEHAIKTVANDTLIKSEADRESIEKLTKGIQNRFGHIAQNLQRSTSEEVGSLAAIGPLKKKVQDLFAQNRRPEAILVVQEIIDQSRRDDSSLWPRGDLNDWFNLSAVLGRLEEEALALEVCLAGLQQQNGAPVLNDDCSENWKNKSVQPHGDLIAHAVQYAKAVNDPRLNSLVEMTGYTKSDTAPRKAWGWRTYDFTMQALHALGRPHEAIELGHDFMGQIATKPDADAQKVVQTMGQIMRAEGQRDESLTLLKKWLKRHKSIPASQVAAFLLDQEFGTVPAKESLKMAQRALDGLVEESPTVNFNALIYQRGLCYDRLSTELMTPDAKTGAVTSADEILRTIDLALRDYKTALNSSNLNPTYASNAQDQIVRLEMVRQDLLGEAPEAAEANSVGLAALQSLKATFDQVKNTSIDLAEATETVKTLHAQQPEGGRKAIGDLLERMAEDTDLEVEVQKRAAHIRRQLD